MLETWQNHWEDLHLINERNAKIAAKCDQKISHMKKRTKQQLNAVTSIQTHIPKINSGIKEIMDKLGMCVTYLFGSAPPKFRCELYLIFAFVL